MFRRAIVIGSSGAGKSTFARKLRDITGLPLYYLDMLWHKSDRTNITREEFDIRLAEILQQERFIIDGNYYRTLEMRLARCDTVFFLNYPLELCLESVIGRAGQKREDMPWIEETPDPEFLQWIRDFHAATLPEMIGMLESRKDKVNVITFYSREEADAYLAELKEKWECDEN